MVDIRVSIRCGLCDCICNSFLLCSFWAGCSPADSVEPNGRRKRYRSSVKIPFSTRQACSLGLDQTDAAPEGGVAPASRERYGKEGAAASAVPDDAPGRPKGESQNLVVTLTFSGKAKENSIAPQYQGFTECYVTNISPELQRLVNKVSSEDLTEDALSPIDPEDIAKARQLLSQVREITECFLFAVATSETFSM